MSNKDINNLVVVLGMHRSGTSAITRSLKILGVDLGNNLMPPVPENNEKGFWEDLDINKLNIDLLDAIGHDWHTLAPVLPNELSMPKVEDFKIRAVEILRSKISAVDYFGLKDPRISRLLPFWKEVFQCLDANVWYIVACRNPLSVAQSLATRDNFRLEKGIFLWIEHMLSCLIYTEKEPRVVVDYDNLLDNPKKELQRIAKRLELIFDPDSLQFSEYKSQFLEESLRHTRHKIEDLKKSKSVPEIAIKLYQILKEQSVDSIKLNSHIAASRIKEIYQQTKANYPALAYMKACEDEKAMAACKLAELELQIAQFEKCLAEKDSELKLLSGNIAKKDKEIEGLYQSTNQKDFEIGMIKSKLAEKDNQLIALNDNMLKVISEYNSIVTSTSWRVTAPIRIISSHLPNSAAGILRSFYLIIRYFLKPGNYPEIANALRSYLQFRRNKKIIEKLDIFDPIWYLSQNSDMKASRIEPLDHYLKFGWLEGRNPCVCFDTLFYLNEYSDVRIANINPFVHYCSIGWKEGRNPSPDFNTNSYLLNNPEIVESGMHPLKHYLKHFNV